MTPAESTLLDTLTKPSDDVDIELLLLLARFEGSVRWNDIPLETLLAPGDEKAL